MSNARSPREVCSTTMGISGLIVLLLASWGPEFRVSAGCSFSGVQIASRASCRSGAIGFTSAAMRSSAFFSRMSSRTLSAPPLRDELLDVLVALAGGAQLLADLVVGDLRCPSLSATASSTSSRATDIVASARSRCSSASGDWPVSCR